MRKGQLLSTYNQLEHQSVAGTMTQTSQLEQQGVAHLLKQQSVAETIAQTSPHEQHSVAGTVTQGVAGTVTQTKRSGTSYSNKV